MEKMQPLRVGDLRDLFGVTAAIVVDSPVPTAFTPAGRVLAEDDDVFVTITLPGGVRADVALTAAEYRVIAKAAANESAARATRELKLEGGG